MTDIQLSLGAISLATANDRQKAVLEKAKAAFGFIPNMYARMANSPGLLETYMEGYQRFREHSGLSPVEQETVLLTISRFNGCRYCMAAHSMVADRMAGMSGEDLEALRDGRPLVDDRLAALHGFTLQMLESRGMPRQTEVADFLAAGYREEQILEIVLAMAVKLLSNYTNHVFDTPPDEAFADYAWPSGG